MPDSVTQILKSGPPGLKKNIAVLGDGFAAGDQTTYNDKVKELLIDGVFGHDYFYEDAQAFNIFRVNLISNDSGVSQRVYDEHDRPQVRHARSSRASADLRHPPAQADEQKAPVLEKLRRCKTRSTPGYRTTTWFSSS